MKLEAFVSFNLVAGNGVFQIVRDANGQLRIQFILPDPPPELRAAALLLTEAARPENRAVAQQFQEFATRLLNSRSNEVVAMMARSQEIARAS